MVHRSRCGHTLQPTNFTYPDNIPSAGPERLIVKPSGASALTVLAERKAQVSAFRSRQLITKCERAPQPALWREQRKDGSCRILDRSPSYADSI
jgi:hypothetical protein